MVGVSDNRKGLHRTWRQMLVECGCRYAEMVIRIRDKIGNEQSIELRV
jgi:hypothetical protein